MRCDTSCTYECIKQSLLPNTNLVLLRQVFFVLQPPLCFISFVWIWVNVFETEDERAVAQSDD